MGGRIEEKVRARYLRSFDSATEEEEDLTAEGPEKR
jgi:hypothetical protein